MQSSTSVQIQHVEGPRLSVSARSLLLVVLAAMMFDDEQSQFWVEELCQTSFHGKCMLSMGFEPDSWTQD